MNNSHRPHVLVIPKSEEFMPGYAHPEDAGLDLRIDGDVTLEPGKVTKVSTGLRVEIPRGYVGFINPRSGLAKLGLTINNSPGTVDAGYQGPMDVLLINHSDRPITLEHLSRIAQLVILPVVQPLLIPVKHFPSETVRGNSGFGSSGLS